jgi:iron complex outermembrane receptor protein
MVRDHKASLVAAFVAAVVGHSAASAAPQSTPAPAPQEAQAERKASDIEEVTVTGSRIRRSEFTAASPVVIITSEETSLEGLLTTAEILQTNTLAAGSQQINDQTTGFVTENGPGANTIALRGVGSSRTLVLLNGRRLSPAGARGQLAAADLNTIPNSIIQRTEVLKDGASSVYGSDAIAGVINLITRKNLDGAEIQLNGTHTFDGGGEQRRASANFGKQFENGGFSISYEYFDRDPMLVRERDFLSCAQDRLDNVTTNGNSVFFSNGQVLDIIDPVTGQSKCFNILDSVADRLQGAGGRFVPDATATAGGGTFGLDLAGWRRVGLSFAQVQAARPTATLQQQLDLWRQTQGAVPNAPDRFGSRTFISPATRNSVYLEGDYAFSDSFEVFAEALYNKRESAQQSWRQLFPNVATANPSNPFGVISRSIVTIPTNQEQEVEFSRFVVGLRGDLNIGSLEGWNYEIFGQRTESESQYTNDIIYNDRVNATTGATACNAALITISGPVTNCQGINWFRPDTILNGNFTDAEKAFLFTRETGNTTYDQTLFGASVSGNVFSLPAGEVGFVLGVEARKDSIDDIPGFNARNSNLWGQTSAGRTKGSDEVREAYTELEVPLLADLPGVKRLTLNGSYRWTDYESYGSDSTYKVGLNWQIVDSVRLRGAYGTSFRAPALFELFLANQTGFLAQSSVDPCLNWNTSSNPLIVQNCGPSGANLPQNWANPNSSALIITGGGAGVLDAETSNNSTVGLIWTPANLPVNLAVDWWRIEIENQVSQFGAGNIVSGCYNSRDFPNDPFCTLFTRVSNPAATNFGQITEVRNSYVNISNQTVEGIDWQARVNQRFGKNTFRANLQLTYMIVDSAQVFETLPEQSSRGLVYNNKWVSSLDMNLDRGKWTYSWGMNLFSEASNDDFYGGDTFGWRGFPSCLTAAATSTTCVAAKYDQTAESIVTHSASVRYRADKWTAIVGVQNIFDKEPPLVSTGSGATRIGNAVAISNYDVLGRRAFATVEYRF